MLMLPKKVCPQSNLIIIFGNKYNFENPACFSILQLTYNAAKCNPVLATNKQSDFIHRHVRITRQTLREKYDAIEKFAAS